MQIAVNMLHTLDATATHAAFGMPIDTVADVGQRCSVHTVFKSQTSPSPCTRRQWLCDAIIKNKDPHGARLCPLSNKVPAFSLPAAVVPNDASVSGRRGSSTRARMPPPLALEA